MVLITLNPSLARLLITQREKNIPPRQESLDFLEKKIQDGQWSDVPPIWITPNLLINTIFGGYMPIKPFVVYNGRHRLEKAIEHSLPIKAYIRYTPLNPKIPEYEKLHDDFAG